MPTPEKITQIKEGEALSLREQFPAIPESVWNDINAAADIAFPIAGYVNHIEQHAYKRAKAEDWLLIDKAYGQGHNDGRNGMPYWKTKEAYKLNIFKPQ